MASNKRNQEPSKRMAQIYEYQDLENDPEFIFNETKREKSWHKPVLTKKPGIVDRTASEIKKLASDPQVMSLKVAYDFEEFKKFSKELQIIYLNTAIDAYKLNLESLGKLFKRDLSAVSRYLKELGVKTYYNKVSATEYAKEKEVISELRKKFYEDYGIEQEQEDKTMTTKQDIECAVEEKTMLTVQDVECAVETMNKNLNEKGYCTLGGAYKSLDAETPKSGRYPWGGEERIFIPPQSKARVSLHVESENIDDIIAMLSSMTFINGKFSIDLRVD